MSDVVVPQTVTLLLSNGRTVTVWAELNHRQHKAMYQRMFREIEGGELRRDMEKFVDAKIVAYVEDWTLTDPQQQPLEIRRKGERISAEELQDVLDNLKQSVLMEMKAAIDAHHDRIEAAAEAQKKTGSFASASSTMLPSVAVPA